MNETTTLLQQMLADREDTEIIAGETGTLDARDEGFEVPEGAEDEGFIIPAHSSIQTGRGPSGRLRNFRAMSDEKFDRESCVIRSENNDPEAIAAVDAEYNRRVGL